LEVECGVNLPWWTITPHPRQILWELFGHIIFDIGLILVETGLWIGLVGAADDAPDVG
jgi:hypothetical protein